MYIYQAKVIKIIDSNTLIADIDLGFYITIRKKIKFFGINAEIKAKKFIEDVINKADGNIIINTYLDKKDRYGQILALVYVDGICLNDELINRGLAEEYNAKR